VSKRSQAYELLRTYVRFAFWLTHKRVVVTGKNHIPNDKPILFAPNHQNALMDPLAVVCTNPHQSVWLARADIFKSKTARPILKFLKLLPVYRIRDGKDNLANNEQIFAQVSQLLKREQSVALFPEASHSGRRQMLPHKKAIPRIALEVEATNNFKLNLQIIPVGIYYSHYWDFNRTLVIQYGEPILVDQYQNEYEQNPQKAMLSLRDEIYNRLRGMIVQIDSETHYNTYELIGELCKSTYPECNSFSKDRVLQQFFAEKELMDKLYLLESKKPESFAKLIDSANHYFREIQKHHLNDHQVEASEKNSLIAFLTQLALVIVSLPGFLLGFSFNAIPFYIPRAILHRKLKNKTFLSSVNFTIGLLIFPPIYLLETIIIYQTTQSSGVSLISLILMPIAGKIAFNLFAFYRRVGQNFTLFFRNKTLLKQMISLRSKTIQFILERI